MAYVSLARQYRPRRFDDVYGQQHVTRTLENAIRANRLAHAYLFCGPRGVGKTTVARILAKALNCEQGPTHEPCGQCESCQRINAGSSLAVIEIDAASNRGIDDMRSLREDVQFAPTDGRVKVYILDEAHQITGPGWEAFLKTLEEPPAHVVFVMATTDPQKLPATILSRCQRFDFRRVAVDDIAARLREVATAEQVEADEAALYAIARAADGGLRDALSVFDQVIAYAGGAIGVGEVEAVLGSLGLENRFALAELVAAGDVPGALAWLGGLLDAGRDARLLVGEALAHFRLLLLSRLECGQDELRTLPEDLQARLAGQAERFSTTRLMAVIEALATCDRALRWHPQPRILLEVTLIDLLLAREPAAASRAIFAAEPPRAAPETPRRPPTAPSRAEPEARAERPPAARPQAASRPPAPRPEPPAAPPVTPHEEPLPAGPLELAAAQSRLPAVMASLKRRSAPLMVHLVHSSIIRVEDNMVVFGFRGWEASCKLCSSPDRKQVIEEALAEVFGRPLVFRGELVEETAPPADSTLVTDELESAVDLALKIFPGARELDT